MCYVTPQGENLTDDELQAMIDEFDRDQDGAINRDEFFAIMKSSGESIQQSVSHGRA
eukprot:SAG11_NODE_666_length_7841_cov_24.388272_10_plen_57_part_00